MQATALPVLEDKGSNGNVSEHACMAWGAGP